MPYLYENTILRLSINLLIISNSLVSSPKPSHITGSLLGPYKYLIVPNTYSALDLVSTRRQFPELCLKRIKKYIG